MIPAARKTLIAGVVCLVVGALIVAFGVEIYVKIADAAGANAEAGLAAVSLIITIIRSALPPLGGALVAAAVVIQAIPTLLNGAGRGATPLADPEQSQ